ncbi:MAG: PAS domain-containing protein, partial [Cyanobacteria bacterium J06642_3]
KDLQSYLEIWQTQMLQLEQSKTKSLQNRNLKLTRQVSQQAQELQEQRYREQLVAEIALKIRQALDLASVLQTTVDEVRKLIEADRVLIYRFEPDGCGIVTTEAVSKQQWSILNQVVKDDCFEAGWIKPYQQGYVYSLADIEQGNLSQCHREFLRSFQVKANLVSPILIKQDSSTTDRLWGLLIVHQCSDTRNWQESELELLQRLTTQVAIAVWQAELYQQAQVELEQRRKAEIALRESESRFKTMANTAPVMIWMSDSNKLYTYLNQPWLDFTGRTVENELGNGWLERVHPEDRASCWEVYTSSFDARQKFTMEYRHKNADQEYRWILNQGVPRYDQSGEFMGYIGSCIDISDRILAEQTLGEKETQLRTALDAAALGTWIWDITTNNVGLSERAQLILGCQPQDSYSLDAVLELIQPEARSEIYAKASAAIAAAELYEIETCITLPDHQERWISARGHVLLDPQGQPTRMMGVVADISEKKRLAEKSLRHQRLESLGSLAGGVAHDLNNILTPILMSVQLLPVTLSEIDPRSHEIIKMLENNVKRGSALVQQVLSFARGIEGKRGIVQIKHLIRDIYQIARETFPKTIEIHTDVASNLWAVCGDATQIHQVLLNLVINARDAMPDGGSLDISAANLVLDEVYVRSHPQAKVAPYVAISIVDTGVGIPPRDLEQIFEPFFTTKGRKGGTGLGLATVINIVESHGGFINVVSEVNQGSQFNIMIPAAESTATDQSEILSIPKGNNELILVVDDEATICEITKASLETHNYRVITANDGIEAIASYVQHQGEVELVLMNMLMPAMDGATAIKTLQKINPQVKIIALSGRNFTNQTFGDADRLGAANRNLNIQSFLAKPYTTQALLQAIKDVLNN